MSYEKVLIDNPTCARRFHLTYESDAAKQNHVKVECPFCGVIVFEAKNHPEVKMVRQENLNQTQELSERIIKECRFEDKFGQQTIRVTKDECCP